MTLRSLRLATLSAFVLAGCATAPAGPPMIPPDREVAAHVRANWAEYTARVAFLSGRRGQSPTLVSVSNIECVQEGYDAPCTFDVRARFEDGTVITSRVDSRYQRQFDGSLERLIPVVVVPR